MKGQLQSLTADLVSDRISWLNCQLYNAIMPKLKLNNCSFQTNLREIDCSKKGIFPYFNTFLITGISFCKYDSIKI